MEFVINIGFDLVFRVDTVGLGTAYTVRSSNVYFEDPSSMRRFIERESHAMANCSRAIRKKR